MKEILKSINITKVYGEKRNTYQALNGIDMKVLRVSLLELWDPQVQENLHC